MIDSWEETYGWFDEEEEEDRAYDRWHRRTKPSAELKKRVEDCILRAVSSGQDVDVEFGQDHPEENAGFSLMRAIVEWPPALGEFVKNHNLRADIMFDKAGQTARLIVRHKN